jgi:hypothetical protein
MRSLAACGAGNFVLSNIFIHHSNISRIMKFRIYTLTLCMAWLLAGNLVAQQKIKYSDHPIAPGPDGIVRCASMEIDAIRRLNNPNLGTLEDFENWLTPKVREYEQQVAAGRSTVIITIPLVVHVLHNGEPVGTGPNITDAQVLSQVQVLNEDFRRILGSRGWNDHPDGADVELEFCPATVDPWGNPSNGVNRVNIGQNGATIDDLEGSIKPSTIWDPTQYMNMWSVKFATPDDNLLGYAQFPEGSGLAGMPSSGEDPNTDGVVIRYLSFGTSDLDDGTFQLDAPYDLGRTATHEVGHWVGLRHIWGDGLGCNLGVAPPGCSCLQDDYCSDTPNSDQANYGCPEGKFSPCDLPNLTNDMIENYMDYTDDPCMNIFTNDQKSRVQAVMANSPRRMELVASTACSGPKPYISFAGTNSTIAEGTSCEAKTVSLEVNISQAPTAAATVSFTTSGTAAQGADFTISPATLTFPAGSAASQFLTLTIFEDGVVESDEFLSIEIGQVTTTGNALKSLTNFRHVVNLLDDDFSPETAGSQPQVLLFSESFNTLGAGWTSVTAPGSAVQWRIGTPPLGLGGNFNAYISPSNLPGNLYLYDQNAFGSASLESPSINAGNATNLQLTFTYTCFGEPEYDFGTLWYSKNGGQWTQFGPAELSGQAIPTNLTVPLPQEANNSSNLRLAFRWENDELLGGHPPFSFDNVELRATAGAPAAVQTALSAGDEKPLGPNATVHFFDPASGKVMATVKNNGSYDYGCVTLAVDRSSASAGSPAVAFWNNNPANALAAKTFFLDTENSNPPAGNTLTVTLFYTKTEILAWEAATLQSRNNLKIVGVGGQSVSAVTPGNSSGFNISISNAGVSNFTAAAYKVTATVPATAGGLGAGVPGATPSGSQAMAAGGGQGFPAVFENPEALVTAIFPNPANDRLTVTYRFEGENTVDLQLQNQLGQRIDVPVNIEPARADFETGSLPDGLYFLVLRQGETVETKRVVVQR